MCLCDVGFACSFRLSNLRGVHGAGLANPPPPKGLAGLVSAVREGGLQSTQPEEGNLVGTIDPLSESTN